MESFIESAQERADREAEQQSTKSTSESQPFDFGFGGSDPEPQPQPVTPSFAQPAPQPAAAPSFSYQEESKPQISADDEELQKILQAKKARIKVVGCGGAGNNTITRIAEIGVIGAQTIAVNTDAQDLLKSIADRKLLIGKEITAGLGSGSNPEIGKEAAHESENDIKAILKDSHMVFLTCGLGGGTGTGSVPIIAEIAKKLGILTVAIVTLPFTMEGQQRYENAMMGLEALEGLVDTLIVIPNDKLVELAPDLPLQTAFKVADEILTNAVKGIAELITKPGLINLDFADIKAVMSSGGIAMIGVGESDTEHRAIESVEKAIQNPLLDVEISGATGALINVVGGANMSLEEAQKVVETVSEKLDDNAKIIWGAQLSPDLQNTVRTMLVVVGVKSPQIFGPRRTYSDKKRRDLSEHLGIEFVD
ncbi:cell division protein FtsZ [Candidatus Woesearchaeota archaeon]|jgi:cell division protein FtsZ|nr:cell division protein FtsZ [Candidatus Woesearchaeota archaeon]MBT4248575.1 cell division protein FtsZ [Candidatus Woesearchaeota archaeon]